MKTKEELIRRYRALYSRMKDGDNPRYMRIFGEAEGAMFASLAASSPEIAEKWLSKLEAMDWDNYLAKDEADMITSRMVSQDGSKGPHWAYDTFVSAVRSLGMEPEDRPHYNSYALWTAANMIYSDHARSIAEDMGYKNAAEAPAEKMAASCVRKAVEVLRDPDKGYDIRDYFRHRLRHGKD